MSVRIRPTPFEAGWSNSVISPGSYPGDCVVRIPPLLCTARYPSWLQEPRSYRGVCRFDAYPCYMNTRSRGDQSEVLVEARLMELGYAVSRPTTEERYDLVVDVGDQFVAVQVKRMRRKESGVLRFDCQSNFNGVTEGKTYTTDEIDGFIAHNPEDDSMYWVSVEDAPKTSMSVRDCEPSNPSPNINWHTDYLLEAEFVDQFGRGE